MIKIFFLIAIIFSSTFAFQPIQIIDKSTAGLLNKKVIMIDVRNYSENAMMVDFRYAPFKRFQFGISYGATNIIGSNVINFNGSKIGLKVKFRPLEEGIYNPAVAIGINTQGYGKIVKDSTDAHLKKFLYPSEGGYIALSKSFLVWMFTLGIHGNMNYSFERDTLPSFFNGLDYSVAIDFGLLSNLYLLSEYDFKVNDKDVNGINSSRLGLWNIGIRWNVLSNFSASFHMKDMLGLNKELGFSGINFDREFRLTYFNRF